MSLVLWRISTKKCLFCHCKLMIYQGITNMLSLLQLHSFIKKTRRIDTRLLIFYKIVDGLIRCLLILYLLYTSLIRHMHPFLVGTYNICTLYSIFIYFHFTQQPLYFGILYWSTLYQPLP
jgi:hypothetical protein